MLRSRHWCVLSLGLAFAPSVTAAADPPGPEPLQVEPFNSITAPEAVTPDFGSVTGGTTTTIHANWLPVFGQLVSGRASSVAVDAAGTVWAWGLNQAGVVAPPDSWTEGALVRRPVRVQGMEGIKVAKVAIGTSGNALAVAEDGTLWGWGKYMGPGFSDIGSARQIDFPEFSGKKVIAAAATANSFTVALDDATTWSWGVNSASNNNGQYGVGTNTWSSTPVQLPALNGKQIVRLEGSMDPNNNMFALDADGGLWGWGYNGLRILGDGSSANKNAPVQPVGFAGKKIVDFDAYQGHMVAVDDEGSLWGWGNQLNAVFGNGWTGGSSFFSTPQKLTQWGDNFVAVSVGSQHTIAVTADGKLYAAGSNGYGQLGNGSNASNLAPQLVEGLDSVKILDTDAGQYSSYAMSNDGRVYAFGRGDSGQIGDDKIPLTASALLPVETLAPELQFTKVQFDGIEGTSLTNLGDARATVVTPAHPAGPVDVQVSMTLGGTPIEPDTVLVDGFTYIADIPPSDLVHPEDVTVVEGEAASFSADATAAPGTGPLSVQWQQSTDDGLTWTDIPDAHSTTYSIAATTLSQSGNRYRAVFSTVDDEASSTTNSALLTVTPTPMAPPTDIVDPVDQTVTEGEAASFSADATAAPGTGPLSVQWQQSTDDGLTWTDISGATGLTYTTPATTMSDDGMKFRALFTTVDGLTTVNTGAALLTVLPFVPTPPPLPELPNNVVQPQPIPKELANTGTVWVENSIWLSLVALVLGILAHIAGMRRKVKRM